MSLNTQTLRYARRLSDLAEEVRIEQTHWRDALIRAELDHVARQLDKAAQLALGASEMWGDAWAEAGTITLRKYVSSRKLIEATTDRRRALDCLDGQHTACLGCECGCHQ